MSAGDAPKLSFHVPAAAHTFHPLGRTATNPDQRTLAIVCCDQRATRQVCCGQPYAQHLDVLIRGDRAHYRLTDDLKTRGHRVASSGAGWGVFLFALSRACGENSRLSLRMVRIWAR